MLSLLNQIDAIVWGPILLVLLVGTGIYLTIRLSVLQVAKLPRALKLIFRAENKGDGDISSFAALATALAATIGTGNIVGVATAIKAGGPGALFWMWVAAFFGMATKYAEGVLAIKYREKDANGHASGGPMYYIVNGLGQKWKPLAQWFAVSGVLVALLSTGTFTQVNSITSAARLSFGLDPKLVGAIVTILAGIIIFGGIHSISKVSEKVIPFMAILYFIVCAWVIGVNADKLLDTLGLVVSSAFSPTAAVGGFAGATIAQAIQKGIARGVFSNEAGLGSAPIAAAAAKTHEPVEQGLVSMTGTFIDTIIICTLTGLSIIITGAWTGHTDGVDLTQAAFSSAIPSFGTLLIALSLILFAFTTILGWNYYGERCFEFLFGTHFIPLYRLVYIAMVFAGTYLKLEVIWTIADIVNALMIVPNLIALLALSPVVIAETKSYFNRQATN